MNGERGLRKHSLGRARLPFPPLGRRKKLRGLQEFLKKLQKSSITVLGGLHPWLDYRPEYIPLKSLPAISCVRRVTPIGNSCPCPKKVPELGIYL